jgi:hypothetical protein
LKGNWFVLILFLIVIAVMWGLILVVVTRKRGSFQEHAPFDDEYPRLAASRVDDGVVRPKAGRLYPDLSRPGIGLDFKMADAERYAA